MNLHADGLVDHIDAEFAKSQTNFPRGGVLNYPDAIRGWTAGLDAMLLPYVTVGAISRDGGHLTLHDREHIERVKKVAFNLASGLSCDLTAYEIVLLVVAIYMHDIGNILGRAGHESRISEVLKVVGAPPGFDNVELRTARSIAGVHGGRIAGSKDTISTLPEKSIVHSQHVRPRLLAALLRLADELADDPARANRVQIATGTLKKEAEVFHQFAANLHSQLPDPQTRTIHLQMEFSEPGLFQRKLGKGGDEVYMLDEIFERSVKTYMEARYCSRFLRPHLDFEKVVVEVDIYDGDGPLLEKIKYSLGETGYGDLVSDIYKLAPELASYQGNGALTPALLRRRIDNALQPTRPTGASPAGETK